jgi:hypothetical protein
MALTSTTTPGESWPAGSKVTLDRLRRASKPTLAISGNLGTSEIVAGAIDATLTKPGPHFYATATAADATSLTFTNTAPSALADGLVVVFKAATNHTSAATILIPAISGSTAKKILKHAGASLNPGDIRNNQLVQVIYNTSLDSANGAWELTEVAQVPNKYASESGGADELYTIALVPAMTGIALYEGMVVRFKPTLQNTSSAASLDIGASDGAKAIRKYGTNSLDPGDISPNQICEVAFDGTVWQLLSPPNQGPSKYATTGGTSSAYTVALNPKAYGYYAGMVVWFKAHTANVGTTTLAVDGLAAKTIKKRGSFNLTDNSIRTGEIVEVVYDGTNFQLIGKTEVIFQATNLTVPAAGSAVGNQAHGMAVAPSDVRWVLVNSTSEAGYVTGDEITISGVFGANFYPGFGDVSDSTNLNLMRYAASTILYVAHKTNGAATQITTTNWKLKVYAVLYPNE